MSFEYQSPVRLSPVAKIIVCFSHSNLFEINSDAPEGRLEVRKRRNESCLRTVNMKEPLSVVTGNAGLTGANNQKPLKCY